MSVDPELVADAEHELRGALTALALAVHGHPLAAALESEFARASAALADLAAAREGAAASAPAREALDLERLARSAAAAWGAAAGREGRPVEVDWDAGEPRVRGDRGRLGQALGNLLANAVEHGSGAVRVVASRRGGAVRVEVVNARAEATPREAGAGRGRGLGIAARAAGLCGGTLELAAAGDRMAAAIELPVAP